MIFLRCLIRQQSADGGMTGDDAGRRVGLPRGL